MPARASARKRGQKGVDAIFTPEKHQRDASILVGLAAITLGILCWTIIILDSRFPRIFVAFTISSYAFMVLSSLGIILVISGAGMCLAFSSWNASRNIGKAPSSVRAEKTKRGLFATKSLMYGFVAFLQSCIAITLYSGLAGEYQSNSSMQLWLSSIFPPSQILLSNEALFATAALLGLLTVQFLPGQAFAV